MTNRTLSSSSQAGYNGRMHFCRYLIITLLLAPMGALAQSLPLQQAQRADSTTMIRGIWPTSCQPVVLDRQTNSAGAERIVLGSQTQPCTSNPHPFELQIEQGATFSPAPPIDHVSPLHVYARIGQNEPQLIDFQLRGGKSGVATPGSGFWWPAGDAQTSGNVLIVEVQGQQASIALLSYDDLSGEPIWFFGTTQLTGRTLNARLSRLDGGASPFFGLPTQPQPTPTMTIDMVFRSATLADVWLSRTNPVQPGTLQVKQLQFSRRSFSSQPLGQRWQGPWLVARDVADDDTTATPWPNRFDFTVSQAGDDLQLVDAGSGFELQCHIDSTLARSPRNCTLLDASGNLLANFDQVGLDRLQGKDSQGRTVILLRNN